MKSKLYQCIDCGNELPRKELNRKFRCYYCATKKLRDTMYQLMAHSGPEYEKWKQSIKAAAAKL